MDLDVMVWALVALYLFFAAVAAALTPVRVEGRGAVAVTLQALLTFMHATLWPLALFAPRPSEGRD